MWRWALNFNNAIQQKMKLKHFKQKCKTAVKTPLCAVLLLCCSSYQDGKMDESESKSLFIYNFTKHIEWPLGTPGDKFVIGLYGNSDILNELLEVCYNKSVHEKLIEVKIIRSLEDVLQCSMLFIPKQHGNELSSINEKIKKAGVLIITEQPGMCLKGSCVNIIQKKKQLRFEISEKAIEQAGLKVSSQLLALAIKVK